MSHAFFKHVLTFPDFTFFNIDPTTLDAIKLSRGCFCTLQLLDSYWYRLILYIVYQALNKYDGSTLFLLTLFSFKHLPKKYEWSNRNIGRFLVYRAWWLVCKDTEFFLEKNKSCFRRENWLYMDLQLKLGARWICVYMIIYKIHIWYMVWFHYFHSVFFFLMHVFHQNTEGLWAKKLFQSFQALGDQFQLKLGWVEDSKWNKCLILEYVYVYFVYGVLRWWYPTTFGFPTKNDDFGVFWGYHHLSKHPYIDIFDICQCIHQIQYDQKSKRRAQTLAFFEDPSQRSLELVVKRQRPTPCAV